MMILRGMPRKRARPLDGFAALASNGDSYEQIYAGHTSGTSDSGAVEVGVVPYRPAAQPIYMPGKPITVRPAPQPEPYTGPAPQPGEKLVRYVIRDGTGRVVKSGYRVAAPERERAERRELEIKTATRSKELQQEFKEQLAKAREDLSAQRVKQARDYAKSILDKQTAWIESHVTNPYKKAKELEQLNKQYDVFLSSAVQRAEAITAPSDLASKIADSFRRANSRGIDAVLNSPGISPVAQAPVSPVVPQSQQVSALTAALKGPVQPVSEVGAKEYAAKYGVVLKSAADYTLAQHAMETGTRPVTMQEINVYAEAHGIPQGQIDNLEVAKMILGQER